jgi:hypothetical protein
MLQNNNAMRIVDCDKKPIKLVLEELTYLPSNEIIKFISWNGNSRVCTVKQAVFETRMVLRESYYFQ